MTVPDNEGSVEVSTRAGDAENVVSVLSVERLTVLVGTRSSVVVVARRSSASKFPGSGTLGVVVVVVEAAATVVARRIRW